MTLFLAPACSGDDEPSGGTDTDAGTGSGSGSDSDSNSSTSGGSASATSGGSGSASGGSSSASGGSGSASASGSTSESGSTSGGSTSDGTGGTSKGETTGGTGGGACADLGEKECANTDGCVGIMGKPLMGGGGGVGTIPCWEKPKFFECMPADMGCGDAETVACDGNNKTPVLFPDTCIPTGYATCDPPADGIMDCQ